MAKKEKPDWIFGTDNDTFKPTASTTPDSIKNNNYYPQIHVNENTGEIERIEIKEKDGAVFGLTDKDLGEYRPDGKGGYTWHSDAATRDPAFDQYATSTEGEEDLLLKSRSIALSDTMTNGTPDSNGPMNTTEARDFVNGKMFKQSTVVQDQTEDEDNTVPGSLPTSANDPNTNPSGGSPNATNTRTDFTQGGKPLTYPVNLDINTQDILEINMLKYEPKPLTGGKGKQFGSGTRSSQDKRTVGTVILPIPGGIKDSNKVEWKSDSMNSAQMELAIAAMGGIEDGAKGFKAELSEAYKTFNNTGLTKNAKGAITAGLAGAAVGKDATAMISRATGMIMNPNMELLFNGPNLRDFNFTFLLAPRSKTEGQTVVNIIRFFKQGMAPIRSASNLFLKAPMTFQLIYKHKNSDHSFLNKFKECALKSCDVNYTPENSYSTYEDGVMTAYSMSLSFSELEPIYNDDYNDGTITMWGDIGY